MRIKYGGAVTGIDEERAIIRSIKKSRRTRNWQAGEEGKAFEKELSQYLGVKHSMLTTSGSCAGLLALLALELPKGSEVLIPAVTFPTIFNIILQAGLKPVVLDSKIGTYNLDSNEIEKALTKKTKAIICVHAVGNPCDMPAIIKIAKKYDLRVIEDNCDGLGSTIHNKPVGSFGDVSFTSFHAAHIVSMGVGGGVFTNDKEIANKVRMYRDWGRQALVKDKWNNKWKDLPKDQDSRFIYEKIGYNFQVLELQAAMGRVQLRKIASIKAKRKKNFDYLCKELSKFDDIILPTSVPKADVCWFSLPLYVVGRREPLVKFLEKNGIETRSMFAGNILRHPAYKGLKVKSYAKDADWILGHAFWISVHPSLSNSDLKYIVSVFKKYYA